MGLKTEELIDVLRRLIDLLSEQKEDLWVNWIAESKKRLLSSDYSGIEKLLDAYGSMGSFNDLVVGYYLENGITQQHKSHEAVNQELSKLRTRAWQLAMEIKHEVEAQTHGKAISRGR